jgi:hypothetical protein
MRSNFSRERCDIGLDYPRGIGYQGIRLASNFIGKARSPFKKNLAARPASSLWAATYFIAN